MTEEEQKMDIYETICILSKDRTGRKERLDIQSLTLEDLKARLAYWDSIPLTED